MLVRIFGESRETGRDRQRDKRVGRFSPPSPIHRKDLVARVVFSRFQLWIILKRELFFLLLQKQVTQLDFAIHQSGNILSDKLPSSSTSLPLILRLAGSRVRRTLRPAKPVNAFPRPPFRTNNSVVSTARPTAQSASSPTCRAPHEATSHPSQLHPYIRLDQGGCELLNPSSSLGSELLDVRREKRGLRLQLFHRCQ